MNYLTHFLSLAIARVLTARFVVCFMLAFSPLSSAQNNPNIRTYAKQCFDRVGLTDHRDLAGPFSCKDGTRLPVHVNGDVKDAGACVDNDCPTTFPTTCDNPAWLASSGEEQQCYGDSFLNLFVPKSNKDVRVALLCRHNEKWSSREDDFDDIAMIVHNKKNGETCWFQSLFDTDSQRPRNITPQISPGDTSQASVLHDKTSGLDGRAVPGPATRGAHKFWMRPKDTFDIGCNRCHDSGPFVVSPWVKHAFKGLKFFDLHGGDPYKNSEPPFNKWPKPKHIDIKDYGLAAGDKLCTACHKVAAGGHYDLNSNGVRDQGEGNWATCSTWIDWATAGQKNVPQANDFWKTTEVFMPLKRYKFKYGGEYKHGPDWDAKYGAHVKQLLKCCKRLGKKSGKQGKFCKFK